MDSLGNKDVGEHLLLIFAAPGQMQGALTSNPNHYLLDIVFPNDDGTVEEVQEVVPKGSSLEVYSNIAGSL